MSEGRFVGSNSSERCVYHMFAVFARRLPVHYIVFAALILAFLVFNCLYALIVNRRQIITTLRTTAPGQQLQQQQQGGSGDNKVKRGDAEQQPLLTTSVEQQQQLHPRLLQQTGTDRSVQPQTAAASVSPSLQLDNSNRQMLHLPNAAL